MANVDLNRSEIKRIADFFESNDPNNYYIYALCDNGEPFYIGKGIGTRCLDHEMNLEDLKKEYLGEVEESLLKKELSDKLKRIEEAKNKGTFDIAIIKYGLTEHEAFMAESTAINIMKLCQKDLTNIINGHTSKKERENTEPSTKARLIEIFLQNCCPEEIYLSSIKNKVPQSEGNVVFISFNKLYPECENETDIWDAVRGCWGLQAGRAKAIKYIFAMHNNVVKGVFKVKRDGEDSCFTKIAFADRNMIPIPNTHIGKVRADDIERIQQIVKFVMNNPSAKGNYKLIDKTLNMSFAKRGFFYCDYTEFEQDEDLKSIKKEFINKYIKDLKMPQGSFTYLY